jgi:hypothetical protein
VAPGPPEWGQYLAGPCAPPRMNYPVQGAAARRAIACASRRGALPPTEARSGDGRGPPDKGRVRRERGQGFGPARAARRLGRTRRAALISASALRVGCGTHRGRDGPTTRPHRLGRVVDAADGPQPPLVASLLPLAVRATREGPCPALPMATRHDAATSPNLGRRVALNEVGVMPRGRGAERRP